MRQVYIKDMSVAKLSAWLEDNQHDIDRLGCFTRLTVQMAFVKNRPGLNLLTRCLEAVSFLAALWGVLGKKEDSSLSIELSVHRVVYLFTCLHCQPAYLSPARPTYLPA